MSASIPRYPWPLLVGALLAACATSSPSLRTSDEAPPEAVSSFEEGCEDERTLLPVCREESDECGLFRCSEAFPRQVLLAFRGGGALPPMPATPASPRRWWGVRLKWPQNAEPVLTFRFNRHLEPKPPAPQLPPGRYVRHHILPQARDLADWFARQGIKDIHQFTIVIPEYLHRQIHSGGPSGGRWNEAWRQFQKEHRDANPEAIYRHAGELLFRFELLGPVIPYHRRRWDK
jgi:uncharacterized lipoprotein (TIGR02269 family)